MNTENPSRRAMLAGIPAAAIGVATIAPAAVRALDLQQISPTPIARLCAELRKYAAVRDSITNVFGVMPAWQEAADTCTRLRMQICQERATSAADLWLKAEAAFTVASGHDRIREDIAEDVEDGGAYNTTMALSVLSDLIRLRPILTT